MPVGNAGPDVIRRTQPSRCRPAPYGGHVAPSPGQPDPCTVYRHRPACGHARADFTSPCTCWSAGEYTWDIPLSAGWTWPPEPRWRLSTHVALWDLRRAVGGCPWIASWQARQTIRVLRRICAVFAAQAGCPGAGVAELGDYRHRPAPVEQADDVLGSKVRRVHRILVGHSASTWSNVLTLRLRVAPARPLRNCCSVRSSSDTTLKVTVFEVVMSSLLIRGAGRVSAPDVEFSHGHRNCRGQEGDVIGSTSGRPPARWSNTAARCTTATPVPAVARARKRC